MVEHVFQELRENPTLVALAGVGLAKGVWECYLQPGLTAKRGWLAVGCLVTAYELACPPGETLSEGVDRALESHKLMTAAVIGVTALHLCNVLPHQVDPFSRVLELIK